MHPFTLKAITNAVESPLATHGFLASMWHDITLCNLGGGNPYHNNQHMFRMAGIAQMIYAEEGGDSVWDQMVLMMACLWHDYLHTAGKELDRVNIEYACEGYRLWMDLNWSVFGKRICEVLKDPREPEFVKEALMEAVFGLIRVTEFPFVHEPKTLLEQCIRDADILYTFADDTGEIVHGLYLELKSSGKFPAGFTFAKFLKGQYDFLNNVVMYTRTGRRTIHENTGDVLDAQYKWAEEQGFV